MPPWQAAAVPPQRQAISCPDADFAPVSVAHANFCGSLAFVLAQSLPIAVTSGKLPLVRTVEFHGSSKKAAD